MKYFLFLFSFVFSVWSSEAQDRYQVTIDISNVSIDQVPVSIILPKSDEEFSEYHMAKIVPGTYKVYDFGRFVSSLKAYTEDGDSLTVERITENKWKIRNGGELHQISYLVDDSWDKFGEYGESDDNIIFEPGGTNIEAERNVFMMNTFGFIGYLKGHQFLPYEVSIIHPENLFGATALLKNVVNDTLDAYAAQDFNFLADGPIMYSIPDTVTRKIANAEVLISTFSPNGKLTSEEIMNNLYDLMEAQAEFLGGELPVDRYAYLIYLYDSRTLSGSTGALEHSYSSLFSLPEANAERINQLIRDVAAHEFLHIVTPLNIHSEEIGKFNYQDPEMSKHLWLYEGVTEYNSMLVQVKHNLYGLDKFMSEIKDKLRVSERFPDNVPFTVMSKNVLEEAYEKMYPNVYYKGALIGMCLDLYILKYSDGEKNLQWLFDQLSEKYGKNDSFDDDELFDVIEKLTYPEVGEFLRTYVSGAESLPISEVLNWVGMDYVADLNTKEISMGNLGLNITEDGELYIDNLDNANEFAFDLGYEVGDVIKEINGEEFKLSTARAVMQSFKTEVKPGDKVIVTVIRENKRGKKKEKKLKAKAIEIEKKEKHFLELNPEPTKEQYKLLRAWTVAED